jgi:uncharacterized protein YndB with AHSA1/START domain
VSGAKPATDADTELYITRVFDAPRETVFEAWTKHQLQWMGPRHHPAVHTEQDFRPGGAWRTCLRPVAGGPDLWQGGVFREIVPPERLVYTFMWDKEHPAHGHETLITVVFTEHDGKTRMAFRQQFLPSAGERDGHRGGWTSAFDRLDELLLDMKSGGGR